MRSLLSHTFCFVLAPVAESSTVCMSGVEGGSMRNPKPNTVQCKCTNVTDTIVVSETLVP